VAALAAEGVALLVGAAPLVRTANSCAQLEKRKKRMGHLQRTLRSALGGRKCSACHDDYTQDCPSNDAREGGIVMYYMSGKELKFT
jgi:hypothetical protein